MPIYSHQGMTVITIGKIGSLGQAFCLDCAGWSSQDLPLVIVHIMFQAM